MFKLDTTSATKGCKNAITIINHIEKDLEYSDKFNSVPHLPATSSTDIVVNYIYHQNLPSFVSLLHF